MTIIEILVLLQFALMIGLFSVAWLRETKARKALKELETHYFDSVHALDECEKGNREKDGSMEDALRLLEIADSWEVKD